MRGGPCSSAHPSDFMVVLVSEEAERCVREEPLLLPDRESVHVALKPDLWTRAMGTRENLSACSPLRGRKRWQTVSSLTRKVRWGIPGGQLRGGACDTEQAGRQRG